MSVQAMSWVIDNSKHNSNEFVVLLMIANHAKSDGTGAWPSVPVLAREARCSEKSVQRAIIALVSSRELQIDREAGPKNSRVYSLPGVGQKQGGQFDHPKTGHSDQSKSPVRGDISSLQGGHSVPRNKEEPSLKATVQSGDIFFEVDPMKLCLKCRGIDQRSEAVCCCPKPKIRSYAQATA